MERPQLQASLGEVRSTKTENDRVWGMGSLAIGVVERVHTKRYTADVKLFDTKDRFASLHSNEGKYACRILATSAGYDENLGRAYGSVIPIKKGNIVLVGFLKNNREKPVVIGVLHDLAEETDENNDKNILEPIYSDTSDGIISRRLTILPSQDFSMVDADGNLEIASHSKSFLVAKARDEVNDKDYDYEDLHVKDNSMQSTVSLKESLSTPLKLLAMFRSSFLDEVTDRLKFFVDAAKTAFRISQVKSAADSATSFEITENGDIAIRRQLDNADLDEPSKFAEIKIQANGKIVVTQQVEPASRGEVSEEDFEALANNILDEAELSKKDLTDILTQSELKPTAMVAMLADGSGKDEDVMNVVQDLMDKGTDTNTILKMLGANFCTTDAQRDVLNSFLEGSKLDRGRVAEALIDLIKDENFPTAELKSLTKSIIDGKSLDVKTIVEGINLFVDKDDVQTKELLENINNMLTPKETKETSKDDTSAETSKTPPRIPTDTKKIDYLALLKLAEEEWTTTSKLQNTLVEFANMYLGTIQNKTAIQEVLSIFVQSGCMNTRDFKGDTLTKDSMAGCLANLITKDKIASNVLTDVFTNVISGKKLGPKELQGILAKNVATSGYKFSTVSNVFSKVLKGGKVDVKDAVDILKDTGVVKGSMAGILTDVASSGKIDKSTYVNVLSHVLEDNKDKIIDTLKGAVSRNKSKDKDKGNEDKSNEDSLEDLGEYLTGDKETGEEIQSLLEENSKTGLDTELMKSAGIEGSPIDNIVKGEGMSLENVSLDDVSNILGKIGEANTIASTKLTISEQGITTLEVNGEKPTKIEINGGQISMNTQGGLNVVASEKVALETLGEIELKSTTYKANCGDIKFEGNMTLNGKRVAVQGDAACEGHIH